MRLTALASTLVLLALAGCGAESQMSNSELAARAWPAAPVPITCREGDGALSGKQYNRICAADGNDVGYFFVDGQSYCFLVAANAAGRKC